MEISGAGAAVGLAAAQTRNDISTAVTAKVNQAARDQGEAVVALLESAAESTQDHTKGKTGGAGLDLLA